MANILRFSGIFLMLLLLPIAAGAAGNYEYTLGDGDVIRVMVYGQPDLTTEERISAGGSISFPLLGRVNIGGLTAPEAAQRIARRLEQEGFVRSAHVSLLVSEFGSLRLSVLGEVNNPGQLTLDRRCTLPEVLALAGGIAPSGGQRVVLVRAGRTGAQQRYEFRLADLLAPARAEQERLWVQAGDVVYVPPAEQFYVYGQVNRPGAYRLDRSLNVMQAVSVGGGFNERANSRRLILYRKQADGTVRELRAKPEQLIQDGDVLFVRESLF